MPYAPWKYMYPRQWKLGSVGDVFGLGQTFQLQTTVSDMVGIHGIGFNVLVPSNGHPSGQISYTYNRFWPSLSASLARTDQMSNGLIIDERNLGYLQRTWSFSGSADLPVLRSPDASADVSFAYDYSAYGPISRIPIGDPTGGITVLPQTGPYADFRLGWAFSNAHRWTYSISNQEGRNLSLNLRLLEPTLGGKFRGTEISWSWTEFITPPWARLHAIAINTQGGFGIGDRRDFFALGGYATQDVVRSVLLNQQQFAFLRGYPVNVVSGDSYLVASGEYRFPLLWIERGSGTFPGYLRRVWGTAFVDAGSAYQGAFHAGSLKTDAGAEAHLEFDVFYFIDTQVQLGWAHGFEGGGGDHIYFVSAFTF